MHALAVKYGGKFVDIFLKCEWNVGGFPDNFFFLSFFLSSDP